MESHTAMKLGTGTTVIALGVASLVLSALLSTGCKSAPETKLDSALQEESANKSSGILLEAVREAETIIPEECRQAFEHHVRIWEELLECTVDRTVDECVKIYDRHRQANFAEEDKNCQPELAVDKCQAALKAERAQEEVWLECVSEVERRERKGKSCEEASGQLAATYANKNRACRETKSFLLPP